MLCCMPPFRRSGEACRSRTRRWGIRLIIVRQYYRINVASVFEGKFRLNLQKTVSETIGQAIDACSKVVDPDSGTVGKAVEASLDFQFHIAGELWKIGQLSVRFIEQVFDLGFDGGQAARK